MELQSGSVVSSLLFADDAVLLASLSNDLQLALGWCPV